MRRLLVVAVVAGSFGLAWAERAPAPTKPKAAATSKAKPRQPARSVKPSRVHGRWAATRTKRPRVKPAPQGPRTLEQTAALHAQATTLQLQAMSAYQAGNYDSAVRKFAAALDAAPSPDLIYQAAQAHRLNGDRGEALELYEQYLRQSPDGSAAPVCRWYVERLRATP